MEKFLHMKTYHIQEFSSSFWLLFLLVSVFLSFIKCILCTSLLRITKRPLNPLCGLAHLEATLQKEVLLIILIHDKDS